MIIKYTLKYKYIEVKIIVYRATNLLRKAFSLNHMYNE
jgi:hypothetical protein